MAIFPNIVETIGNTPIVRLNSVARDLPCTIAAKIESFNPGGSVKDRIGPAIIEHAEREGLLKPGGTIIEATSGNTGVGLAMAAATKGYHCIFIMPDKMSQEKILLLRAFGARVIMTPTAVEPDDPRSYYSVAHRLADETPNSFLANQYHNPLNPESHYNTTGPEIWEQTETMITHLVAGMGTGGTISGAGRFLKEQNPQVKIIGVDPHGSILFDIHRKNPDFKAESYKVEGIGEDFLPSTTDLSVIDEVVQVTDRDSFLMSRRLVREEGIFAGGSSGSAVWGAIHYAREHKLTKDDLMIVILPDTGSRYLSKAFDDDWLRENGFLDRAWVDVRAWDVYCAKSDAHLIVAKPTDLLIDVIALLKLHNISQVPVIDEMGTLQGLVTEVALLDNMLRTGANMAAENTIEAIVDPDVVAVKPDAPLESLMDIFTSQSVALIISGEKVEGILTKIDILDFLSTHIN